MDDSESLDIGDEMRELLLDFEQYKKRVFPLPSIEAAAAAESTASQRTGRFWMWDGLACWRNLEASLALSAWVAQFRMRKEMIDTSQMATWERKMKPTVRAIVAASVRFRLTHRPA